MDSLQKESPDVICRTAKVKYWYYMIRRAAVLPGGHRQHAGGYSSYRGMSGCGCNTQIHVLVAIAGHAAI